MKKQYITDYFIHNIIISMFTYYGFPQRLPNEDEDLVSSCGG